MDKYVEWLDEKILECVEAQKEVVEQRAKSKIANSIYIQTTNEIAILWEVKRKYLEITRA